MGMRVIGSSTGRQDIGYVCGSWRENNCNCYPYEGQREEVVAVDRSHNKVLAIQKLAVEMVLNCITTYKLDALKAVHRRDESSDMHTSSFVAQEPPNIDFRRNENFTNGQATQITYTSKAELRKSILTQRNGVGRNHGIGGRVEKSEGFSPNSFNRVQKLEGFSPNSFDRVLLDASCSALGLRPRLFAGENGHPQITEKELTSANDG
ncbi:hypothetical protein LOK49_LG12G00265 [Camellia lanceoleosa]|uniref:Uncharacterized protein n=1 Tax=Camellia lanceoleosa TaxID=1840588 RepID=A0ACC0FSD6_9ERIC|nr:hypothetical protein LOK49_LG12G00265 [Camellia lanceoleosa]